MKAVLWGDEKADLMAVHLAEKQVVEMAASRVVH